MTHFRAQLPGGSAPTICLTVLLFATLTGCGQDSLKSRDAGQALGEHVTEFASGVGAGVDNRMQVEVELSPALAEMGLTRTAAKKENLHENSIEVYVIAAQQIQGTLMAKALNAADQEIGRASTNIDFGADDAGYIKFDFPPQTDSQNVSRFVIDYRAGSTEENEQPE